MREDSIILIPWRKDMRKGFRAVVTEHRTGLYLGPMLSHVTTWTTSGLHLSDLQWRQPFLFYFLQRDFNDGGGWGSRRTRLDKGCKGSTVNNQVVWTISNSYGSINTLKIFKRKWYWQFSCSSSLTKNNDLKAIFAGFRLFKVNFSTIVWRLNYGRVINQTEAATKEYHSHSLTVSCPGKNKSHTTFLHLRQTTGYRIIHPDSTMSLSPYCLVMTETLSS